MAHQSSRSALCFLLFHWPFTPRERPYRDCPSNRHHRFVLSVPTRTARARLLKESGVGDSNRSRDGDGLVWTYDGTPRVDVHQSVYCAAPLRPLSHEQVSPSPALLLLLRYPVVVGFPLADFFWGGIGLNS